MAGLKRVLVVQNAICEHLGTLQSMFELDGFAISSISADGHIPSKIDGNDVLVVLGGPASVYEDHGYLREEERLIRDAMAKNIPTLGICLGSQLVAKACDARVHRGPRKEIGWYTVELTDSGLEFFKGPERKITVFQWHGDTYDLPSGAAVLATSSLYPVQAFKVGNAIGIQFHLEVSRDMVMEWMKVYRSDIDSSDYINANDIVGGLDNINLMNQYSRILYKSFRKLIGD
jgi:GMP synthase-like glutamine amidotransferase